MNSTSIRCLIKKSIARASEKNDIFCPGVFDHRDNRRLLADFGVQWSQKNVPSATHHYRQHALSLSFKSFSLIMISMRTVYLASFRTKIVFLGDLPYIKDSKCPVRNMSRPQHLFFKKGKAEIFLYWVLDLVFLIMIKCKQNFNLGLDWFGKLFWKSKYLPKNECILPIALKTAYFMTNLSRPQRFNAASNQDVAHLWYEQALLNLFFQPTGKEKSVSVMVLILWETLSGHMLKKSLLQHMFWQIPAKGKIISC